MADTFAKMTRVKERMPPDNQRVLTYLPQYHGAVKKTEDGMTILLWNPAESRWCTDEGESPMFDPTHWMPLPRVDLDVAAEGVTDKWPGGGRAWSR